MGSCQNYGPLLGPLNTRCRSILRTQKGTIILTTIHIYMLVSLLVWALGFEDSALSGLCCISNEVRLYRTGPKSGDAGDLLFGRTDTGFHHRSPRSSASRSEGSSHRSSTCSVLLHAAAKHPCWPKSAHQLESRSSSKTYVRYQLQHVNLEAWKS